MSIPNPYATPQLANPWSEQASPVQLGADQGLWRQGSVLVMHKRAPLPDICLKSNQPATRRLRRKLQWHHPAISFTILAGLIVYLVLAAILTKRATLMIPLIDEWFARRRKRIIIAWVIALVGIAMFVVGALNADTTTFGPWLIIASVFVFLGGLIYGQYAPRLIYPQRITDEYVWLKGVHPEFLDRLPVWPYNI